MELQSSSAEIFKKYLVALENAKMGLWELDFQSNNLKWDEGIRKLYEIADKRYSGSVENWITKVHIEDQNKMKQQLEEARLDQIELNTYFRYHVQPGNIKYFRSNAFKVRDSNNEIIGLVGLNWDVTENYKLQEENNKHKIFIENIFNSVPDPIFIKDSQLNNIYSNKAFEEFLGLEKEKFIGKKDEEYLPAEIAKVCRELDDKAFQQKTPVTQQEEMVFDTKKHFISTKKTVFTINDNENYLVGIIRDLTELKKIQNSLIEQSQFASLGQMASELAHEVNNPLMIVQARAQMLQEHILNEQGLKEKERILQDLASIEINSQRIAKIIKTLNLLTQHDPSEQMKLVSLLKLVDEAYETCKDKFIKNGFDILIIIDENIDYNYFVSVNELELIQLFVNLLNNSFDALKETQKPSKKISRKKLWAKIMISLKGESFRIDVIDSGQKIPESISKKMMDPFYSTKGTGQGIGLGLTLAKEKIQKFGGEFYYDKKSKYTKFSFSLKCVDRVMTKRDSSNKLNSNAELGLN